MSPAAAERLERWQEAAWQVLRRLPLTALTIVAAWSLAVAISLAGRQAHLNEARRDAELFARVMEDHVRRALGTADLALSGVAVLWAGRPAGGPAASPHAPHAPQAPQAPHAPHAPMRHAGPAEGGTGTLGRAPAAAVATATAAAAATAAAPTCSGGAAEPRLAGVVAANTLLRSVAVAGTDGVVVAASHAAHCGLRLDAAALQRAWQDAGVTHMVAGRDLDALAAATADGLAPSAGSAPSAAPALAAAPPLRSGAPAAGSARHRFLLRVQALPGAGGWVVAALNADQFTTQFELTVAEPEWRAVALGPDGALVAATDAGAQALADGSTAHRWAAAREQLRQLDHGVVNDAQASPALQKDSPRSAAAASGQHAGITAYRAVRGQPLVVLADLSREAALAPWRGPERAVFAAAALASLLAAAYGWIAHRHRRHSLQARQREGDARRQLREQYEQTEQLVDAMPLPVFLADLEGTLLVVNRAWIEWLELDRELAPVTEAERQARLQQLLDLGADEAGRQGQTFTKEIQLPRSGGAPRDAVLTKVPLMRDEGGRSRLAGVIGTLIDVSEYREAARATERARMAAEEASHARAEFVANVTHELRTPLQAILGFAELGGVRSEGHDRLRLMFNRVHQAGRRMLRLVEDLLDISRIGSAVGSVRLQAQEPVPVVREVIDELVNLARKKDVMLPLRVAPALAGCRAQIDSVRLAQVVRNVVANAVRFTAAGTSVEVTLNLEGGEGSEREAGHAAPQLVCLVRDHGPGVPEAELEAIFEPFVQSSRTKDGSGGTGLGLTICRKIMQAHDGSIRARNHEAGGAEFRIALALLPADEPALPASPALPSPTGEHATTAGTAGPAALAAAAMAAAATSAATSAAETAGAAPPDPPGRPARLAAPGQASELQS